MATIRAASRGQTGRTRLPRHLGRIVGVTLFLLALHALRATLRDTPWSEIGAAFDGIPKGGLALSALLVAIDYLALSIYDLLGLRDLRFRLPLAKVAGVLIAFRAPYFVLPLLLATVLFGLHTLRGPRTPAGPAAP